MSTSTTSIWRGSRLSSVTRIRGGERPIHGGIRAPRRRVVKKPAAARGGARDSSLPFVPAQGAAVPAEGRVVPDDLPAFRERRSRSGVVPAFPQRISGSGPGNRRPLPGLRDPVRILPASFQCDEKSAAGSRRSACGSAVPDAAPRFGSREPRSGVGNRVPAEDPVVPDQGPRETMIFSRSGVGSRGRTTAKREKERGHGPSPGRVRVRRCGSAAPCAGTREAIIFSRSLCGNAGGDVASRFRDPDRSLPALLRRLRVAPTADPPPVQRRRSASLGLLACSALLEEAAEPGEIEGVPFDRLAEVAGRKAVDIVPPRRGPRACLGYRCRAVARKRRPEHAVGRRSKTRPRTPLRGRRPRRCGARLAAGSARAIWASVATRRTPRNVGARCTSSATNALA